MEKMEIFTLDQINMKLDRLGYVTVMRGKILHVDVSFKPILRSWLEQMEFEYSSSQGKLLSKILRNEALPLQQSMYCQYHEYTHFSIRNLPKMPLK